MSKGEMDVRQVLKSVDCDRPDGLVEIRCTDDQGESHTWKGAIRAVNKDSTELFLVPEHRFHHVMHDYIDQILWDEPDGVRQSKAFK